MTTKKYKNWDWNYGESPQYSDYRDGRFAAGTIQVYLEVEQGRITKCSIRGDFFSKREIQDVETQLIGVRMVEEDIKAVLDTFELTEYFGAVTSEELTKLILGE